MAGPTGVSCVVFPWFSASIAHVLQSPDEAEGRHNRVPIHPAFPMSPCYTETKRYVVHCCPITNSCSTVSLPRYATRRCLNWWLVGVMGHPPRGVVVRSFHHSNECMDRLPTGEYAISKRSVTTILPSARMQHLTC
ncbi:hypothetical protein C8Q70DRAFT_389031 [Cubamyces menziesii]|nr:hypothetical protein C8Q70DRAFT_389031 [Cubamyces menziesii]